jgi:hypothetical protein
MKLSGYKHQVCESVQYMDTCQMNLLEAFDEFAAA